MRERARLKTGQFGVQPRASAPPLPQNSRAQNGPVSIDLFGARVEFTRQPDGDWTHNMAMASLVGDDRLTPTGYGVCRALNEGLAEPDQVQSTADRVNAWRTNGDNDLAYLGASIDSPADRWQDYLISFQGVAASGGAKRALLRLLLSGTLSPELDGDSLPREFWSGVVSTLQADDPAGIAALESQPSSGEDDDGTDEILGDLWRQAKAESDGFAWCPGRGEAIDPSSGVECPVAIRP